MNIYILYYMRWGVPGREEFISLDQAMSRAHEGIEANTFMPVQITYQEYGNPERTVYQRAEILSHLE